MPDSPSPQHGALPRTADPSSAGTDSAWIRDALDAVYRFARRCLPPSDAEDVAHDAFAALFSAQRAGRAPADAGAYLFGVARRRIADRWRRAARGHLPGRLPEGWEAYCERALPPEAAGSRELAACVNVALGLLDAGERELLLARYRDGLPTARLAERLRASDKAVELRLRRARAHLRERLGAVGRAWCAPDDAGGEASA